MKELLGVVDSFALPSLFTSLPKWLTHELHYDLQSNQEPSLGNHPENDFRPLLI